MPKNRTHTRHKKAPARRIRWLKLGGYISLKHVALFAAAMGGLGLAFGAGVALRPEPASPTASLSSLSHSSDAPSTIELIKRINAARTANQQPAINTDYRLQKVADSRLQDMIANQYYAHQNLNGKYYYDMLDNVGLAGMYSCENLSIEPSLEAQDYVDSWLASKEGHRECLLSNKVTAIGIAAGLFSPAGSDQTDPTYLVVTIYGNPPKD